MDTQDKSSYLGIKLVLSLISVFLMIPLMSESDSVSFFRTLYIFLIARVVDMGFLNHSNTITFFRVWTILNQLLGAVSCAISFVCMVEGGNWAKLWKYFFNVTENLDEDSRLFFMKLLLLCAMSCLLKDAFEWLYLLFKDAYANNHLKEDISKIFEEKLL